MDQKMTLQFWLLWEALPWHYHVHINFTYVPWHILTFHLWALDLLKTSKWWSHKLQPNQRSKASIQKDGRRIQHLDATIIMANIWPVSMHTCMCIQSNSFLKSLVASVDITSKYLAWNGKKAGMHQSSHGLQTKGTWAREIWHYGHYCQWQHHCSSIEVLPSKKRFWHLEKLAGTKTGREKTRCKQRPTISTKAWTLWSFQLGNCFDWTPVPKSSCRALFLNLILLRRRRQEVFKNARFSQPNMLLCGCRFHVSIKISILSCIIRRLWKQSDDKRNM